MIKTKKYSIGEHFFYPIVILTTVLLLIVFACSHNFNERQYLIKMEQIKQANCK